MPGLPYSYYMLPSENWVTQATMSATSQQATYEAIKAKSLDPIEPWWAASGTATLTATFPGARDVDIVAVIHGNGDDGNVMTIGGGLAGTVASKREKSGYPRNVAYYPGATVSASSVSVGIAGNSLNFAIGELVAGKLRQFLFPIEPGTGQRIHYRLGVDDEAVYFKHLIRYDLGSEHWHFNGTTHQSDAALEQMRDLWSETKGGSIPFLFIEWPGAVPRFVRMEPLFNETRNHKNRSAWWFTVEEANKGKLVA